MPNRKIHCEFTRRKYHVTGEDLHKWIDDPAQDFGPNHRMFRHENDDWIPQRFVNKYGLNLAKAILRSHIWLDTNWDEYKHQFYRTGGVF